MKQFPDNSHKTKNSLLSFFYHDVEILESKAGIYVFIVLTSTITIHGPWPIFLRIWRVSATASASVKCMFSQTGIIDMNCNWLANIKKKLKLINKMIVAVYYHFLSTLINTCSAESVNYTIKHYT